MTSCNATFNQRLDRLVGAVTGELVACRRDFHTYAETGWTEFRTASLIARRLVELGLDVRVGREVIAADARMGLPAPPTLAGHWARARAQGGDPDFLDAVKGGYTGVVGVLGDGDPVVGLRVDIDALELHESHAADHRPVREGFVSVNDGAMHACGHDGHAAIGLGVASVLSDLRDFLPGTLKLIFQPAEEGVRGAKAMVAAGVVDDVDYMLGLHLYSGWPIGQFVAGKGGFFATDKFDAFLIGEPAHAGGNPQAGHNALLAAATAALNLHAIPRHRDGATRINVGKLIAGQGRNVIPPSAHMVIETRGATTDLNAYMYQAAIRVLEAAAAAYGCDLEIKPMGGADSADSDVKLAGRVARVAGGLPGFEARPAGRGGGSEDFTYMMRRVQERGGLATSIGLGADLNGAGHHTATFDFDERALPMAVHLVSAAILDLQCS
jgi:aminobenzoyl-glutamate utilization protein A